MTISRPALPALATTPLLAALLLVALCLSGCSSPDALDLDAPIATSPNEATQAAVPPPRPVAVPELVGLSAADARSAIRDAGLRLRADRVAGSACLPDHQVFTQRPRAGSEVLGESRVIITVNGGGMGRCGLDLPPVDADLERIGADFVDFAREGGSPAADTPVGLFLGGVLATTIPPDRLSRPTAWQGCPGGVGYAGRSCPVSAVLPLVDYPGPIAVTTAPPTHSCAHPSPLPDRLEAYRSVTLTPDEPRDCSSYFGIQLFVNDVGQVVDVNVVLSEP